MQRPLPTTRRGTSGLLLYPLFLHLSFSPFVAAHDHHSNGIPEGSFISPDPLDNILWIHIFAMVASFGVIFPLGMVLGIVRSRWHVPVQVLGTAIAVMGWFLGHAHKGRQFAPNIHAAFASSLMLMLASQVAIGVYLKLHLERGWHAEMRLYVVKLHGVVGKLMPLVAWTQMLFGGITAWVFTFEWLVRIHG